MGLILDTDVIVQAEKQDFDLPEWLDSQPETDVGIASITVAELWHGVERTTGTRRVRREAFLQALISSLTVYSYTGQTGLVHARLWASLLSSGRMIGQYDLIVAATAVELEYAVVTFNTRHFRSVKGLTVIEPR